MSFTEKDAAVAPHRAQHLLNNFGLHRKAVNGFCDGSMEIDNLGEQLNSAAMRVYVWDQKKNRISVKDRSVLSWALTNRCLLSFASIRPVYCMCVSLKLSSPRSIFFIVSRFDRK